MIEIEQISKSFGKVQALNNVSMTIGNGEIVGLLGLNGAGKTTLMRIIYGLLAPTVGTVKVDGLNVATQAEQARLQLGVLPDGAGLYKRLTARENIAYFARLQGMNEAAITDSTDQLIDILRMDNIAERYSDGFSLGERMKTALARAIVHKPQHVLLDEPTNGLDVITTRAVRALLRQLKSEGRSVLFSSHLMYEVENLCDRVLIISGGQLVAGGRVEDVLHSAGCNSLEEAFVALSQAEVSHVV
ncbi:ATP-binding cassette domain-containing protein [Gilvimarinus sp. SDUM040013]|uniref:ATP-binding cassette domain-containing protein n=1 Tax=Gilvimarinus gilvus TaxID=3058038 RepID=A0ABU4S107_9GAMM|nr:ATP-binding cassette domain-containing protein [Gilvimarinus sp. SDUM040013]MDO3384694.1 ATP-binding cassette domain-containing protein [Gilvimarinus sp. SDUM040013]MDX6850831.1 ATP-binding cassette domain-containing protein [Gilvimarinus sp. SDUM040013]